MNQKLEDLKLLVKNDKRVMAAGAFIIAVLFIWIFTDNSGRRQIRRPEDKASKQGMGAEEAYKDLIDSMKQDLDTAKTESTEQGVVIRRLTDTVNQNKEQVAGIFESLVDRVDQLSREIDLIAQGLKNQPPDGGIKKNQEGEGVDAIEKFGEEPAAPPLPPIPPRPTLVSVIAPGDFVDVRLLTGVNAPVDGTPYPVVFALAGAITGPDGASLDLGEARLIAAAQGSEVDSRALFRLSSLSIRHPSGRRDVIKVDGWVVGEDGIRGMTGRLIDKLGRLILATAGVSFTAALGDQLTGNSSTRNTRDRNQDPGFYVGQQDLDYATASALTDSSNRLGKLLLDRYESFVPVVEVLSSREAVAIFSQTAEVDVLEQDDDGGIVAAGYGFGE